MAQNNIVTPISKNGVVVHPAEARRLQLEAWATALNQALPMEERLVAQGHALGWMDWAKAHGIQQ